MLKARYEGLSMQGHPMMPSICLKGGEHVLAHEVIPHGAFSAAMKALHDQPKCLHPENNVRFILACNWENVSDGAISDAETIASGPDWL